MDEQDGAKENPLVVFPKSVLNTHFTLKEVSKHYTDDACWIIIWNSVYNVTDYLHEHPGGIEIMMEYAGSDATSGFLGKGHSVAAVKTLEKYLIGHLTKEDRLYPDVIETPCTVSP